MRPFKLGLTVVVQSVNSIRGTGNFSGVQVESSLDQNLPLQDIISRPLSEERSDY